MATRRRKRRIRIRPVFLLIVVVIGVIALITVIVRSYSGVIGNETILFTKDNVSAVIIRDEEIFQTEALGGVKYLVDEGEIVPMGKEVAKVYRSGNNENLLQQLYNVQQEIYDYQINTKWQDVVNVDLTLIQERITAKYKEIAQARKIHQSDVDLLTMQRELTDLLNERTTFLKESTQPDSKLNDWYQSEKTISDALNSAQLTLTANATGRISFHLDGYESVLRTDTLDLITAADVNGTLSGQDMSSILLNRDLRPVYRIVQTDRWYLAISTTRRDNYVMAVGNSYQIQIAGQEQTYPAEVIRAVREPSGGSLYILQVTADVRPIMNIRSCQINISGQFSSLTVNKRAVVFDEDGNASIDVGGDSYVAIEVISENEDKYVFRSNTMLQPGRHVNSPEG